MMNHYLRLFAAELMVLVGCLTVLPDVRSASRVEAYASQGFGVAKVTLDLAPGASSSPMGDDRFAIVGENGNVLYPVMQGGKARELLRGLLGVETPRRVTYYFLFLDQRPFNLTAFTPRPQQFTVQPKSDARRHRKLFDEWWRAYSGFYERVHRDAEYPVGVQAYLTALWSGRLGVDMPQLEGFFLRDQQKGGTWLGKTTGDEAYRASVLRDLMLGEWDADDEQLLPIENTPEPIAAMADVPDGIEPLATVVPAECFYLRFGSFENYSWTKKFLDRSKGDLTNLVALRSIQRPTNATLQQQLGLSESALSTVLGPTVINDVALVGLDPYLRDGAAFGIVFEASNNFLLGSSLGGQRRSAAKGYADAQQETVTLAGQEVSYFHTPGGELRSYFAQRDNFHMVTTSRTLAERFLQAGKQRPSLAQATDFVQARAVMPGKKNGTVFAHVPRAFWDQLTSPAVRIEFERRQRSLAEIEALALAGYAARQERVPAESPDQLMEAGYLPLGFGSHADGSTIVIGEGGPRDSVRGTPGRMIPIADMPATSYTPTESKRYAEYVDTIRNEAGWLPPVTVEIERNGAQPGELERVMMRVRVGDYARTQVANIAKRLAPPMSRRVAPIAGDVVAVEVLLNDPLNAGEPIHVFAGLRNSPIPLQVRGGGVGLVTGLGDAIRGYIGFWPKPALFEALLGRPRRPLDADGCAPTSSLFDLWTRRLDGFFLFSFKRDVLIEVGSQLAIIDTPETAQGRLFVDDLAGSQLEYAASAFGYARARQTSASGSRFMNSLHRQLGVPKADCQALAIQLVGGEFVCPLGGQYLLVEIPGGVQAWASTAAAPNNQFLLTEIPSDFQLPLLQWFRGLEARLTQTNDDAMLLHVDLRASGLLNEIEQPVEPPAPPVEGAGEELPAPPPVKPAD